MSFYQKQRFPSKNRKDYYAILGIDKTADKSTIAKAYRQQALLLHPDKNPGQENYNGFLELNDAYETLNDPQKRSMYDASYNFNNSIPRHFDPKVTPTEATPFLQEFFELFLQCKAPIFNTV